MMDRRALNERMRRKRRQLFMRRVIHLATYVLALALVLVFVIRGIILPILHKTGREDPAETQVVQAQTAAVDPDAAIRQSLMGQADLEKVVSMTPGWHEDSNGKWYRNTDGTYYANGMQEINGLTYSFDENGYVRTGWVSKGFQDLFFNEDGSYNPGKRKPMLALTYDDGPGQYTSKLLDCLEEYNAHATFFMQGQNVAAYPEEVKRMADLGCDVGTHSWNHPNLYDLSSEQIAKQFSDTDDALIKACGQPASVARAPYGNGSQEIYDIVDKPFFLWSLDSLDWDHKDVQMDIDAVMNGDLTDGSIILMHDIHETSVDASLQIIPMLVEKGYKLVTVSELAEAKGVNLKNAAYTDFWDSSLEAGNVAGYEGNPAGTEEPGEPSEDSSGDEGDSDEDSGGDVEGSDDYNE